MRRPRRPFVVGLTGGLGSGKSTALAELRRLGARTVSADAIAHELSRPGGPVARAVARAFGRRFLAADGSVDRPALARRVFGRAAERRRLERATHPLILRELRRRLRTGRSGVAVADVPLLFETGLAAEFDLTVAVSAPSSLSLARVARRDGMRLGDARRRMSAQWPDARKAEAADLVWRNAGSRRSLFAQVRQDYQAWRLIAGSPTA